MPVKTISPSEQLTHCTVRIECTMNDGSLSSGTGFFFRCFDDGEKNLPVIVTNKHVIDGAKIIKFNLTLRGKGGGPIIGEHHIIELGNTQHLWMLHPDPEVDLCVMPVENLLTQFASSGNEFFFTSLDKSLIPSPEELADLGAIEDVVMVGYPNGIWDSKNNMPIVRRGVTATHPNLDYEGRKEFVIDAACFPGSSGSPVFLYNNGGWFNKSNGTVMNSIRIKFLGVLYAGPQQTTTGEIRIVNVPTQQSAIAVMNVPINLGHIIKSSRLFEMDALIRDKLKNGVLQY
jgi:hypothetical protein